jgi:ATP-dependent RNA helicase RhlE
MRHAVIFGGVGQRPQEHALQRGVDILVATPGRLLDLIGQRLVPLERLEILVVDEADRMLDMGFLPAVRRILASIPKRRQTLFFSATMGAEPQGLADRILSDPARVAVTPSATTVETVTQSVFFVEKHDKQELLEHFLRDAAVSRALVFTRTKHSANRVAQRLCIAGIEASALHGNKSQAQRERAMRLFRAGGTRVLVATDIAARGIDVDDVSHVVNFDVPNIPESYVHRIGRTARAGASGSAVSFCGREERSWLASIEREIRMKIPVIADHPWNRARPGAHAPHAPHAPARYALPHAMAPAHAHPARAHAPAPQRAAVVEGTHPRPPAGAAPFHGGWIRPARGPGLRGRRRR